MVIELIVTNVAINRMSLIIVDGEMIEINSVFILFSAERWWVMSFFFWWKRLKIFFLATEFLSDYVCFVTERSLMDSIWWLLNILSNFLYLYLRFLGLIRFYSTEYGIWNMEERKWNWKRERERLLIHLMKLKWSQGSMWKFRFN